MSPRNTRKYGTLASNEANRQAASYAGQSKNYGKRAAYDAGKKIGEVARKAANPDRDTLSKNEAWRQTNSYLGRSLLGLGNNPDSTPTPTPPVGSNNNSGGSGAGGGMAAAAQAALDQRYSGMEAAIKAASEANQNAFAESQAKMKEFYDRAAENRKEPYAAGVKELSDNLANLGMDFTNTDVARDWDKSERRLQETADLALANDLSWFEKMKSINPGIYNDMLIELAQAKLAAQSGGGGRFGGGGRRGGGRGSSGSSVKGDIQSDSDVVFDYPGLAAAIAGLPQSQAESMRLLYEQGGGDISNVLQNLAERSAFEQRNANRVLPRVSVTANPTKSLSSFARAVGSGAAKASAKASQPRTRAAQDLFRRFATTYQPVNTRDKINTTGKEKR